MRWQAYVGTFALADMERYERMGLVLVKEQTPLDAVKVQSLLDMRELQEQMDQLHAVNDVLAAGR